MTKPLSPTQAQILSSAAQHLAGLAKAPPNLPAAARNTGFQSMLKAGLLEEVANPGGSPTRVLRITTAGLMAAGEPSTAELAGEAAQVAQEGREAGNSTAALEDQVPSAAQPQPRNTLRDAATALLVAWDAGVESSALPGSIEVLRAALGCRTTQSRAERDAAAPRRPREGTKHQTVLTLLRREEGATIAGIMEATGWAQHTVRGFLAGLKKKGHTVEVLERVRQVGSGAQGAKGSYSVYRLAAGEQS
ncbi:DUF3489 domain-containing protein [Muricoccus aerilatus]|uniref:DUF3489 domain-containing protein n=1 Tax=Muricoccus aerilatus TaxID=452982 RepID=UPI0005C1B437|nr:DUF3489 domain-containing protein [Roseomonas aerilata]